MSASEKQDVGHVGSVFEIANGVVLVTVSGRLNGAAAIEVREAFMRDALFEPGMPSLWDLREASISEMDTNSLRRVVAHGQVVADRRGSHRTALLVTSDLAFGIARMYEVLSEGPVNEVAVFRSLDEALDWIRDTPPPAP